MRGVQSRKEGATDLQLSLGRHAFEAFVGAALRSEYEEDLTDADFGPHRCYRRAFHQGSALPLPSVSSYAIYITDYLPLEPFRTVHAPALANPGIVETLRQIKYADTGKELEFFAFMTGYTGVSDDVLSDQVASRYRQLLNDAGFPHAKMLIGSVDTVMRHLNSRDVLGDFVKTYTDGLSISLGLDGPAIDYFVTGRVITSGVCRESREPLEPLHRVGRVRNVLDAMEQLLRSDPKEKTIEDFLRAYYREIFGFKYDQIATQLWLTLPTADLSHRKRRSDILIRNAVTRDWELVELKRADVKLTGTHRDMPTLSKQVYNALLQTKVYQSLLRQDSVRRALAKEGVEYSEPVARLVIGREPTISHRAWRWLRAEYGRDPELLTYDDLLVEMRLRADEEIWR